MRRRLAYFDTSILLKRYFGESGSVEARRLSMLHSIVTSVITPIEAAEAVSRRHAHNDLSPAQHRSILAGLRNDRAHWRLIDVNETVLARAEDIVQAHVGIRTLDALHLASARLWSDQTGAGVRFITADMRQRRVARELGLHVLSHGATDG